MRIPIWAAICSVCPLEILAATRLDFSIGTTIAIRDHVVIADIGPASGTDVIGTEHFSVAAFAFTVVDHDDPRFWPFRHL